MTPDEALDPIRSMKAVWKGVSGAPAALVVWWFGGLAAGFAIYMAGYLTIGLSVVASGFGHGEPEPGLIVAIVAAALVFFAVFLFANLWWHVGLSVLLHDALRTGRAELTTALSSWPRTFSLLGASLLLGLLVLLSELPLFGLMLALVPSMQGGEGPGPLLLVLIPASLLWMVGIVWVSLGFVFITPAIATDGCGPVEALARSWELARGRRWRIFVFTLFAALLALAGMLAFCVGYLATAAFPALMPTEAYLALTRGEEYSRWWVTTGVAPEAEPPEAPPAVA